MSTIEAKQKVKGNAGLEDCQKMLWDEIRHPPRACRPIGFWFLNHRLEEEEILRQVRQMADQGLGGFMLHGRSGLRTGYLSEEWAHYLGVAIAEAERLGLEVWLYDENHYPSGPAGGLLPLRFPDRTMKSLVVRREIVFPAGEDIRCDLSDGKGPEPAGADLRDSIPRIALAASLDTGQVQDLSEALQNGRLNVAPMFSKGNTVLYVLEAVPWRPVAGHEFAYYPDYFDPELTDEFIARTHRWYHQRFGDRFGKTIQGIFSDNSCANFPVVRRSVPWGKDFETRFRAATGKNLRDVLPALFCAGLPDARRARLVFWRFMGQAYLASFYRRITDYCSSVNLFSTGHLCLEDGMGEHARQIGDYFEVQRHFTLTAVDQVGPTKVIGARLEGDVEGGGSTPSCLAAEIKNTASTALFTGSPRVMCESFGLVGAPWRLTMGEIRRIAGWLFALGVDLFVPHGLFYSIAGGRKWECTPDHLHNPQWPFYRVWTDWIGRLSAAGAGGTSLAQVAVLYPIHSLRAGLEAGLGPTSALTASPSVPPRPSLLREAWTEAGPGLASDRGADTNLIEATYRWTAQSLLRSHLDFEIVDETLLATSSVVDGAVAVPLPHRGEPMRFKVLVLPAMTVLEPRTVWLIEEFIHSGGRVVLVNGIPTETFDPERNVLEPEGLFQSFLRSHESDDRPVAELDCRTEASGGNVTLLKIRPTLDNRAGDKLLAGQIADRVTPRIAVEAPEPESGVIVTRTWEKAGVRFFFLFNAGTRSVAGVRVRVAAPGPLTRINLDRGDLTAQEAGEFVHDFDPAEGLLLAEGSAASPAPGRLMQRPKDHVRVIPLEGPWSIEPDRDNVLPLTTWTVQARGRVQTYSFVFFSEVAVAPVRLLLDQERSDPELEAGRYRPGFRCLLNSQEIKAFFPGRYLDRNIYEGQVETGIRKGENVLEVSSPACLIGWETRPWPPMVVGKFGVYAGKDSHRLGPPVRDLAIGNWVEQGFACYAGEITYTRQLDLPACGPNERLRLDLGEVADAVRVSVDGEPVGTRIIAPWLFDLSEYAGRCVRLSVAIANTPNNLFMAEKIPAGLLGPVCLKMASGK